MNSIMLHLHVFFETLHVSFNGFEGIRGWRSRENCLAHERVNAGARRRGSVQSPLVSINMDDKVTVKETLSMSYMMKDQNI